VTRLLCKAETIDKVRKVVIQNHTGYARYQCVALNILDRICTTFCLMTSVFTHMKSRLHNDIWKWIRMPEWCSIGGSGLSWMRMLLFFID